MPSSLTVIHPSASVCSTRPRVSVCGTGTARVELSGFSRRHGYPHYRGPPEGTPYFQVRIGARTFLRPSAPTPLNRLFRQAAAVSLPRPRIATGGSDGILTVSAIGVARRLSLRSRLTLIRLALIRKPWSCGGGGSRPPYRYLYLHLPFQRLHGGSRPRFRAAGMLPYRPYGPASSAGGLYPIIIHARPLD